MSVDCFAEVLTCRDEFVRSAAQRLLNVPLVPTKGLTPKRIPAEAGVYMFWRTGDAKPFHIGESSNLRQRIYMNQLRGQIGQSPLKRKIKRATGLQDADLPEFIFENFQVRFMPLSLGRIEVEDYLNVQYGIVESRPNAQTEL